MFTKGAKIRCIDNTSRLGDMPLIVGGVYRVSNYNSEHDLVWLEELVQEYDEPFSSARFRVVE